MFQLQTLTWVIQKLLAVVEQAHQMWKSNSPWVTKNSKSDENLHLKVPLFFYEKIFQSWPIFWRIFTCWDVSIFFKLNSWKIHLFPLYSSVCMGIKIWVCSTCCLKPTMWLVLCTWNVIENYSGNWNWVKSRTLIDPSLLKLEKLQEIKIFS